MVPLPQDLRVLGETLKYSVSRKKKGRCFMSDQRNSSLTSKQMVERARLVSVFGYTTEQAEFHMSGDHPRALKGCSVCGGAGRVQWTDALESPELSRPCAGPGCVVSHYHGEVEAANCFRALNPTVGVEPSVLAGCLPSEYAYILAKNLRVLADGLDSGYVYLASSEVEGLRTNEIKPSEWPFNLTASFLITKVSWANNIGEAFIGGHQK